MKNGISFKKELPETANEAVGIHYFVKNNTRRNETFTKALLRHVLILPLITAYLLLHLSLSFPTLPATRNMLFYTHKYNVIKRDPNTN